MILNMAYRQPQRKFFLYVVHLRSFTGKDHLMGQSLINNDKTNTLLYQENTF